MLNNRQLQIIKFYTQNQERYVTSKELSEFFSVSVRTIKNDLKEIRALSGEFHSFCLETRSHNGTKVIIHDEKTFATEFVHLQKAIANASDSTQKRIDAMTKLLLDSKGYTTKYQLSEKFFISESTLYNYINEIKESLAHYNLKLIHKTNLGYQVIGNEVDKRMCIVKSDLHNISSNHLVLSEQVGDIYNVVADTFIKYRYQVQEQTLQNITAHIALTLERVKNNHWITNELDVDVSSETEFQIAYEILSKLLPHCLKNKYYNNEVHLLTLMILGKLDYSNNDELQGEINEFISYAFALIQKKYCVNLDLTEDLRLRLALHMVPLFYRIKSGTQLVNESNQSFPMTYDIVPMAYDIALYFSLLIKEQFGLRVSHDETSYLSLYFNYGLEENRIDKHGKKILIITPLRKSETMLLRHRIIKWFHKQIEEINFVSPDMNGFEPKKYDAIFSTEKDLDKYKGGVSYISLFPDENDYEKINLAINGYMDKSSIINKFCEECFFYGKASSKEEILDTVIKNATKKYNLDDCFYDVIKDRENISSTYFGNGIAMPHPLTPFSDETFVSIGALKRPVKWDKNHDVQFVMLVSIAKNSPREFQFWYHISSLVRDDSLFLTFYKNPTYDHFIQLLKLSLEQTFS